ncbi:MAG TPA: asparagine synthase (glutamine-hydrolyzing) [Pyrinomonadaceae bacterium]|nr:asparagine synthase (glutamine-hydrolyzing) [Pyrinomonadaceae bacterium]
MCGIVGYMDLRGERRPDEEVLLRMCGSLRHRGPDSAGTFVEGGLALGFRRLSIIDLETGDQPLYNEDRSLILVCNGEIYNYVELKEELEQKGHAFRTRSDVEVLLHLYEEEGADFVGRLNGQFAFALYDRRERRLLLARDHFGVSPLYYTIADGMFIFASEIKAILEHPLAKREVDLTGLDQVLSLPGLVSPRTMFKGVESLKSGHRVTVNGSGIAVEEYWDLDYPRAGDIAPDKPESFYLERLEELLFQSVKYRLRADVPVGVYLSGGLDSSMVASVVGNLTGGAQTHSFSIGFADKDICETPFQRMVAQQVGTIHHEVTFDWSEIERRLPGMVYHAECPIKETYNTCSMALSEAARGRGVPVVLSGEGADELFAGYVGYRFDRFGAKPARKYDLESILEDELRERVWGDREILYETDLRVLKETNAGLYSAGVNESFEDFNCFNFDLVNTDRLAGRHVTHQRSYLDFKLRLSDHLVSEHGDRMALANSVEGRYPFLDINLVEFARSIPPDLHLSQLTEKYLLKRVAENLLPREIITREKFGFRAPGSPYLLQNVEWVHDTLSYERIKRQGYFDPEVVESLKRQYSQPGFKLNFPYETDLLNVVLTFSLFLDVFGMPGLS